MDLLSFEQSDFISQTSHFALQLSLGGFQGLDLLVHQPGIVRLSRGTLLILCSFLGQGFFTRSNHLTKQFDLLLVGRMTRGRDLLTKVVILPFQSCRSREESSKSEMLDEKVLLALKTNQFTSFDIGFELTGKRCRRVKKEGNVITRDLNS